MDKEPPIVRLARLVKEMRDEQRKYFKERTQDQLTLCRVKESEVDQAVGFVLKNPRHQAFLFEADAPAGEGAYPERRRA